MEEVKGLNFMNKRIGWFIFVLAVIVLFFSSLIIAMEKMTTKTSKAISSKEKGVDAISKKGLQPTKRKYDVFKPKPKKAKRDQLWLKPNLDYKFTGKEPVLDI